MKVIEMAWNMIPGADQRMTALSSNTTSFNMDMWFF